METRKISGVIQTLDYDKAHRLTGITDGGDTTGFLCPGSVAMTMRWTMVVVAVLLASACGPAGIGATLVNPCNTEVEFRWQHVPEGASTSPSLISIRNVPARGQTGVASAGVSEGWEVLVTAPALGYEERWVPPGDDAEWTFEPDASLCPES